MSSANHSPAGGSGSGGGASGGVEGEAARLERVRRARVRPRGPIADLTRLMLVQVPEMRRLKRSLAPLAAAWGEVVPAALAERTRIEGVAGGVLNIAVPDAATRFEVDRFLRAGGETTLLRRLPMAVRRIRVRVG